MTYFTVTGRDNRSNIRHTLRLQIAVNGGGLFDVDKKKSLRTVLFEYALNTFYLWLYGVNEHRNYEKENRVTRRIYI